MQDVAGAGDLEFGAVDKAGKERFAVGGRSDFGGAAREELVEDDEALLSHLVLHYRAQQNDYEVELFRHMKTDIKAQSGRMRSVHEASVSLKILTKTLCGGSM